MWKFSNPKNIWLCKYENIFWDNLILKIEDLNLLYFLVLALFSYQQNDLIKGAGADEIKFISYALE